jgi:hypothetical protein
MCKLYKVISGLIILLAGISSAKDVTLCGTIIDTVLETGSAIDPVLKIMPAKARLVSIDGMCQQDESTISKYFATTSSDGKFSVTMNLPETCKSGRYYITAACTTSSNTVLYKSYSLFRDSILEKIQVNFVRQNTYVVKTIKDSSYSHSISFIQSPQIKGGDTMKLRITTMANIDNADTLKYADCSSMIQLTTSNGRVFFESLVGCNYPSFTLLTQKNSYFANELDIVIPKDLRLTHPEFTSDRTVILTFKVGSKKESYSFTVLDPDIKVDDITGTVKTNKNKTNDGYANMSRRANSLFLDISRSGNYSVELFSPNGRLIQNIAQNHHFESGKHSLVIDKSDVNSSQMIIARLECDGVKAFTFLLK